MWLCYGSGVESFLKFVVGTLLRCGRKLKRMVRLCYKGDSYRLDKSLVYNFFMCAIFVVTLLN